MFFKYANSTTCIRSDNLAAIAQAVRHLLEQEEGCRCISKPPQSVSDLKQLRSHPEYTVGNLWVVGLFPSDNGWTIVKTWPYALFCQRAKGASHPRLSALAMQLECDAFHLWVNRSVSGILLEADAKGRTFVSGCADAETGEDESYRFYDEQVDVLGLLKQFSLLQVPQSMQAAMRVNEDPEILQREAEYKQLRSAKNTDSKLLIELLFEVSKGSDERIDNALAEVIDSSKSCWYLLNLVYYAYAEPQRLEAKGAQLLYFQPPITYNPPRPYIPPPPQPLSEEDDESF